MYSYWLQVCFFNYGKITNLLCRYIIWVVTRNTCLTRSHVEDEARLKHKSSLIIGEDNQVFTPLGGGWKLMQCSHFRSDCTSLDNTSATARERIIRDSGIFVMLEGLGEVCIIFCMMMMARKSTGKNTDTNDRSFQMQLITAKNVKLQEVCCENAEKKVHGNVCKSKHLKCNPAASTAAPRV
jgi:hypothetical protein